MTGLRCVGEAGVRGLDELDLREGRVIEARPGDPSCGVSGVGVKRRKATPWGGFSVVSKLSPAVSYSPTGSPLQYHRRKES